MLVDKQIFLPERATNYLLSLRFHFLKKVVLSSHDDQRHRKRSHLVLILEMTLSLIPLGPVFSFLTNHIRTAYDIKYFTNCNLFKPVFSVMYTEQDKARSVQGNENNEKKKREYQ